MDIFEILICVIGGLVTLALYSHLRNKSETFSAYIKEKDTSKSTLQKAELVVKDHSDSFNKLLALCEEIRPNLIEDSGFDLNPKTEEIREYVQLRFAVNADYSFQFFIYELPVYVVEERTRAVQCDTEPWFLEWYDPDSSSDLVDERYYLELVSKLIKYPTRLREEGSLLFVKHICEIQLPEGWVLACEETIRFRLPWRSFNRTKRLSPALVDAELDIPEQENG